METNMAHVPTRPANDGSNAAASTQYVDSGIATAVAGIPTPIPSGTAMVFFQASAPTGWTSVAQNDKALRVVSAGTTGGTTGGTNSFSTVFAQTTVGNHTLTTAELASHTHSYSGATTFVVINGCGGGSAANIPTAQTTGSAGSGTAHNHTITMSITYCDVIICTKN